MDCEESSHLFLGERFTAIDIEHAPLFKKMFKKFPQTLSAYTFASLFSWKNYKHAFWFASENTLLISREVQGERQLLQPVGAFPLDIQTKILEEFKKLPYQGKIFLASDEFVVLNKDFCNHFDTKLERSRANYLYSTKDLTELRGRHYEKKRNLLSQAEDSYDWQIKQLPECCHKMCMQILADVEADAKKSSGLKIELSALTSILDNYSTLEQQGIAITIDGVISAFSIYEELNPTTAVVHFEKADKSRKGLYQLINRETARAINKAGYEFINREEDLGIEGLRQAKTSYFPLVILSSHALRLKP